MGSCPRCRTINPEGAAFCRKCGVRLPAAAAAPPPPPPQVVYVNQPGAPQRVEVVYRYKKRNRLGCGTLILLLASGCCLWGFLSYHEQEKSKGTSSDPSPAPAPAPATPPSSALPFRPPSDVERQEYEMRVAAKVDSMTASGMIQIDFPRRVVFFNPQIWEGEPVQKRRAEWEAFREYFRIKTGSRDVRILSSIDSRDLGWEVR